MHQTKKGNEWHFGMKVHIGVAVLEAVEAAVGDADVELEVDILRQ